MFVQIKTVSDWRHKLMEKPRTVAYFFSSASADCQQFYTMLERLSKNYDSAVNQFIKIDVYETSDIACGYRISIAPTIIFFQGEQKIHEIITAISEDRLKSQLDSFCRVEAEIA